MTRRHKRRDDLVLETERLRLRRFRRDDVDAIFAIIGDDVAMQYYPKTFNRRDAVQWIERNLRRYAEHGYGLFAVTLKDSEDVIGDCGIVKQDVEGETAAGSGLSFSPRSVGTRLRHRGGARLHGTGVSCLRRRQGDLADPAGERAFAAVAERNG